LPFITSVIHIRYTVNNWFVLIDDRCNYDINHASCQKSVKSRTLHVTNPPLKARTTYQTSHHYNQLTYSCNHFTNHHYSTIHKPVINETTNYLPQLYIHK